VKSAISNCWWFIRLQLVALVMCFDCNLSYDLVDMFAHLILVRCSYPYSTTACTITIYVVHSKLDYCHSLNLHPQVSNDPTTKMRNSFARAVVRAPKSRHISPILRSIH